MNVPAWYSTTIFTTRKRSFGQGNVFTPVCHPVHKGREGLLQNMHYRSHDKGVYIQVGLHPGDLHPGGSASRAFCIGGGGVGQTFPQDTWDATGYGEKVSGTHPTEMTSS